MIFSIDKSYRKSESGFAFRRKVKRIRSPLIGASAAEARVEFVGRGSYITVIHSYAQTIFASRFEHFIFER